ncbi:hypothetical protein IH992_03195 [Candidatus Poribacteria bacterium]|nr:hypothetical protein [Candidatus Poribacteria bacterium]
MSKPTIHPQTVIGHVHLTVSNLERAERLDSRCQLAEEFGADVVINAADEDVVQAVGKLTNGKDDNSQFSVHASR